LLTIGEIPEQAQLRVRYNADIKRTQAAKAYAQVIVKPASDENSSSDSELSDETKPRAKGKAVERNTMKKSKTQPRKRTHSKADETSNDDEREFTFIVYHRMLRSVSSISDIEAQAEAQERSLRHREQ